ncbi:hypothetical protein Pmar_PMAR003494 [Perkinsus marinus ATCC 50983]|uniref:Transmembrane protein 147 n=1 Tax=Perkinsus marinus (strain ATCC 50983 / TXsc) TaxID=423536 RepID=C5KHG9_PERM5|nr:hypothetical protein Pmar_PMAR003494 [Perkinsus marinus ATCC 50983]EER16031.1 hypothetical protein Pmar_PMAR003494 [Perkinsus marinus ATCC 50983]|eukprot:XP_002784235.1 hypothetical protein Pmar_PMAR003494 [Perkinsus marinus ATCC 50983]
MSGAGSMIALGPFFAICQGCGVSMQKGLLSLLKQVGITYAVNAFVRYSVNNMLPEGFYETYPWGPALELMLSCLDLLGMVQIIFYSDCLKVGFDDDARRALAVGVTWATLEVIRYNYNWGLTVEMHQSKLAVFTPSTLNSNIVLAGDVSLAVGIWLTYKFGRELLPLAVVFLSVFVLPGLSIYLRAALGMHDYDNEFMGIVMTVAGLISLFAYWVWAKYYPEGSAKQAELDEIAEEKRQKEALAKEEETKSGDMVPQRRSKKARAAAAKKNRHD